MGSFKSQRQGPYELSGLLYAQGCSALAEPEVHESRQPLVVASVCGSQHGVGDGPRLDMMVINKKIMNESRDFADHTSIGICEAISVSIHWILPS